MQEPIRRARKNRASCTMAKTLLSTDFCAALNMAQVM